MASVFKNAVVANIGVTSTTVYTAPALTTSTMIGLSVCNVAAVSVTVNITLTKGGTTVFLAKNIPLPYGSSFVAIGGDQKVVLETGNLIKVQSNAASSVDAIASILELT